MDGPAAANSGHQGTAMALAPLGHVLYSRVMRHDPSDPTWRDRDRFILSAGHASILQYALLHLNGYAVSADDLRAFRQWGSATPGHPEAGHTPGVEVTTGPLGQGIANAVGMAMAEANLRARYGSDLVNHHTWVIAGDGCLMEGISHEAASLAGHLGLDHLVCVFDDNRITIDGPTDLTVGDDTASRFRSYGWHVIDAGDIGEDLDALEAVLNQARAHRGAPTLVVLRTHIGFPSPDHTDSAAAHGLAFGAEDVARTKEVLGLDGTPFELPANVVDATRSHAMSRGAATRALWQQRVTSADRPWNELIHRSPLDAATLPTWFAGDKVATRKAIQACIDASVDALPGLLIGSADLTGNTGTKAAAFTPMTRDNHAGRQIHYGVREHAMGAAMVGMARHGDICAVGGTFFVFADYMRPAIRLAALCSAPCVFVFSHDSVAVGEDGPTHQPVEHLASLRAMPGLEVIRPADANETAAAWAIAAQSTGPVAMILSRQDIAVVTDGSAVHTGAGIVVDVPDPAVILIGTGAEVSVCVDAAAALNDKGVATRVVSMPSWERFSNCDPSEQAAILTPGIPTVSVEAGVSFGWERWSDRHVGIDRFGASAPGGEVLERLGISVEAVTTAVEDVLGHA
ncbi:MAG: transketolase [Ilumatobacteraceae bacterium]|nr:transketolase [Ilumatobacteraceae bacterium]